MRRWWNGCSYRRPMCRKRICTGTCRWIGRCSWVEAARNKDSLTQVYAGGRAAAAGRNAKLSAISADRPAGGDRLAEFVGEEPRKFSPGPAFISPLTIAVKHRRHDMLPVLLDLGLDPNETVTLGNVEGAVKSSGNPLWHAVLGDDWESVTLLLDRGADPNANVYASGTATSVAFGERNARMQKLMLEHGGNLSPDFLGRYRQTDRVRRWFDGSDPIAQSARPSG